MLAGECMSPFELWMKPPLKQLAWLIENAKKVIQHGTNDKAESGRTSPSIYCPQQTETRGAANLHWHLMINNKLCGNGNGGFDKLTDVNSAKRKTICKDLYENVEGCLWDLANNSACGHLCGWNLRHHPWHYLWKDGRVWSYLLLVPAGVPPLTPLPLTVFNVHPNGHGCGAVFTVFYSWPMFPNLDNIVPSPPGP